MIGIEHLGEDDIPFEGYRFGLVLDLVIFRIMLLIRETKDTPNDQS
jgi:hypothetical protein